MFGLERHVRGCGLEAPLLELVKMRASQLNGCAFCLDMHSKDARAAGERRRLTFKLPASAFAFYDPARHEWVAEAGEFNVAVGASSRDVRLEGRVRLPQTSTFK